MGPGLGGLIGNAGSMLGGGLGLMGGPMGGLLSGGKLEDLLSDDYKKDPLLKYKLAVLGNFMPKKTQG